MNKDINGLTLFVESACADHRLLLKAEESELTEALTRCPTRIREAVSSDTKTGWWVPISFYNKINGNRRNYTKKLWENVKDNQKDTWCGSAMLCDHPSGDSDGNPKDICGVWLDMKLGEADQTGKGLVFGLLMPSGRNGEDLQSHLQNGLKIGTSSSGFGKLMGDGVTVDPDTYMIERLADWVLNPSQGTYFSYDENNGDIKDRSIRESEEDTDNKIEEGIGTGKYMIGNTRDYAIRYKKMNPDASYEEVLDQTQEWSGLSQETIERILEPVMELFENNNIKENNIKETVMKDSVKFTKLEEKRLRRDLESFLESADNNKDPQEKLNELQEIMEYLEDGACPDLREKVEAKIAEEKENIKKLLSERLEMKEELGVDSVKDLKEKMTKIAEEVKMTEKEAKDWKSISEQLQKKLSETKSELDSRPTKAFVEYQKEKINRLQDQMAEHDKKASEVIDNLSEKYHDLAKNYTELNEKIEKINESSKAKTEKFKEYHENSKKAIENLSTYKEKYEAIVPKYKQALKEIEVLKKVIDKNKTLFEKANINTQELIENSENKDLRINTLRESARKAKAAEEARLNERKAEDLTEQELYYESLYRQYGREVERYKNRIVDANSMTEAKNIYFKEILPSLNESVEIDRMRLPKTLSMTAEERAVAITGAPYEKESSLTRMPKGWR